MADYYQYSTPELVRMLGQRFRTYRLLAKMTQKEVAEQTGLTLTTVSKFENGTAVNVTLPTFLLLLKAVGCIDQLEHILPELPESPYLLDSDNKKVQRIRHKRHE